MHKICPYRKYSSNESPNFIYKQLCDKIKATGPLTVADYMKEVLTNPVHGYYMNKDVFGKKGDFITSPEISQLFGEIIAIWFINEWNKIDSPKPFNLIELGPGRGTMLQDIIRVFKQLKVTEGMNVILIEVSKQLSKLQAENLCCEFSDTNDCELYYRTGKSIDGIQMYWYRSLKDVVTDKFSLIVAHEFFDALPIHKLQKTNEGWREILVDIDEESTNKFKYVISRNPTPIMSMLNLESETRDHVEICPEAQVLIDRMSWQMEKYGGIALVIDYGHMATKSDTFRAFKNHLLCNPLHDAGSADLTADLDFHALKKVAEPRLITYGPVSQRDFLIKMNAHVRLEVLLNHCKNRKDKETLISGFKMLTSKDQMGSRFQCMCFFPSVLQEYLHEMPVIGFS